MKNCWFLYFQVNKAVLLQMLSVLIKKSPCSIIFCTGFKVWSLENVLEIKLLWVLIFLCEC